MYYYFILIQLKYSNLPYENILQWVSEHSSHLRFPLLNEAQTSNKNYVSSNGKQFIILLLFSYITYLIFCRMMYLTLKIWILFV